jgi:hypothetical protein
MFRALAALSGGSTNSERFIDHSDFAVNQTTKFTKQYPSIFPTQNDYNIKSNAVLTNASLGLSSFDPNTRQSTTRDIDIANYATSLKVSQSMLDANQVCKVSPIDTLIGTTNYKSKVRCGWIYTKGNPGDQPIISQGYLGTSSGPLSFLPDKPPTGTWYWDLDAAKKQVLTDRCGALVSCTNVGAPNYANCAYSKTKGVGVPVNANGRLLYPGDIALSAPTSSLIMDTAKCSPSPAFGTEAYNLARSRDLCTPLENGALSRDCMLQQIKVAGCKEDGNLYQSLLNDATPDNYAAGLQNMQSFKQYQQYAKNPLLDGVVRSGKTTTDIALGSFRNVASEASKVDNTALNYAARDLCLNNKLMDTFDFCSELTQTSPSPFTLDCLQKAWRRAGGLPAGTAYPTTKNGNANKFNASFKTWGAYIDTLNKVAANCKSSDEKLQRDSLKVFMGIERDPVLDQIDSIPGIEVFWFNRGTNTFMGRRVSTNDPNFPLLSTWGNVDNTKLSDMIEYYTLVNVRPPSDLKIRMKMTTDDGMVYVLNLPIDGNVTRGLNWQSFSSSWNSMGITSSSGMIAANYDQPPTTYTNQFCWDLKQNGPNYINGFWQETGGFSKSEIVYSSCSSGNFQAFPSQWMTLTQEPNAPMFSWEGKADPNGNFTFTERRFPSVMDTIKSGGYTIVQNRNQYLPFPALLQLTKNSSSRSIRLFEINSWRTLTLSFIANQDSYTNAILLNFDALTITLEGKSIVFSWQSSTLNSSITVPNIIPNDKNIPVYIMVNMRSQYRGTYPNTLSVYVAYMNNSSYNPSAVQTLTTTNNDPLYSLSNSGYLTLGDINNLQTANVQIGSLRLFDYELNGEQVQIDMVNNWKMKYII